MPQGMFCWTFSWVCKALAAAAASIVLLFQPSRHSMLASFAFVSWQIHPVLYSAAGCFVDLAGDLFMGCG